MLSHSVMSDSLQLHGLQPSWLLCPWNFQARILEWLGILPNPGIKPISSASPALAGRFFTTSTTWEVPRFHNILLSTSRIFLSITYFTQKINTFPYKLKQKFHQYSIFKCVQCSIMTCTIFFLFFPLLGKTCGVTSFHLIQFLSQKAALPKNRNSPYRCHFEKGG